MAVILDWFKEMEPGDVYIFNDPYSGGIHANDVKLVRPIFFKNKVVAFNCSTGHWPDVGGALPGSFNPRAIDCYSEGIRIPPMRIFRGAELDRTVATLIEYNMRTGRERLADVYAQYRAGIMIEQRSNELLDRHGLAVFEDLVADIFDYTETMFRRQVAEIPDGTYEFEDFGDKDIMHPDQPRIRVHCIMTIEGEDVTFDYRGSDPAPRGPFGFPRGSLGDRDFRRHAALLPASRSPQPGARAEHPDSVDARKLCRYQGAHAGVRLCLRRLREGGGRHDGVLGARLLCRRASPHVCGGHQPRQSVHRRRASENGARLRQLSVERRRPGRAATRTEIRSR